MTTVAVIGGGVSGLSAAYYLAKASTPAVVKKIILLEASSHLGGWIQTTKFDDGAIFEHGPRSLRGYGKPAKNTLELVEELGLVDDVVPVLRKSPAARNRYIYVNGQIHVLPRGLRGMMFKQTPFSKSLLSQLWKEPFKKKSRSHDESIHNFAQRRLSPEIAKYALDAMCRGVFAGDSTQLSIKSCFPDIYNFEKEYGSIIKGALRSPKDKQESKSELVRLFKTQGWPMYTLRNGLQQLSDALVSQLKNNDRVVIATDSPCTKLHFHDNKITLKTPSDEFEADHCISSCYSKTLAEVLPRDYDSLSQKLLSIPSVTVGVVNLEYPQQVLSRQGFGHLIPSCERSKVMGVIYESCVFPQHDSHRKPTSRLTCMMGGAWFKETFGDENKVDPDDLVTVAMDSLKQQLNIDERPRRVMAKIQKECIPQYLMGHSDLLDDIDSDIMDAKLPLSLVGSSYKGVSVNDCILNAKKNSEHLAKKLAQLQL